MEVRIYPPRRFPADARSRLEVGETCHLHPPGRTEMVQQRALAGRADCGDLIQLALPDVLRTARAVRCDGEPMRLVAQALEEIQHRVARRKLERLLPIPWA